MAIIVTRIETLVRDLGTKFGIIESRFNIARLIESNVFHPVKLVSRIMMQNHHFTTRSRNVNGPLNALRRISLLFVYVPTLSRPFFIVALSFAPKSTFFCRSDCCLLLSPNNIMRIICHSNAGKSSTMLVPMLNNHLHTSSHHRRTQKIKHVVKPFFKWNSRLNLRSICLLFGFGVLGVCVCMCVWHYEGNLR